MKADLLVPSRRNQVAKLGVLTLTLLMLADGVVLLATRTFDVRTGEQAWAAFDSRYARWVFFLRSGIFLGAAAIALTVLLRRFHLGGRWTVLVIAVFMVVVAAWGAYYMTVPPMPNGFRCTGSSGILNAC